MLFEVYAENLCSATHRFWSSMSTSVWVVLIRLCLLPNIMEKQNEI